jgi:hypothetical protein
MKMLLAVLVSVSLSANVTGAIRRGETIKTTPEFARESLRGIVAPWFYRSMLISPIEGWVVVRGTLVGTRVTSRKIVHSDAGGAYDQIALDVAEGFRLAGLYQAGSNLPTASVLVHLLVYQIDGAKMAVSFAHLDDAGGSQLRYFGSAWLATQKGDQWVEIESSQLPRPARGKPSYTLTVRPVTIPDATPWRRMR